MADRPPSPEPAREPDSRPARVARGWGAPWFRRSLLLLGSLYIGAVFCEAAAPSVPETLLPRPLLYFTQIAQLFPRALDYTIQYRAEAYDCTLGRFVDFDERPLFPIHADDDESRFFRALFFYRREPKVMTALDDFIASEHNRRLASGIESAAEGGLGKIGGVLLMSLRIPIPAPGTKVERFLRKPLATYPKELRNYWHITSTKRREERCAVLP